MHPELSRRTRLARALTSPYFLASAWTLGWLCVQYAPQIGKMGRVRGVAWWRVILNEGTALGALSFFAAALLLYGLFAWANADAFRTLLEPRLTRTRRVVYLAGQLMLCTLALHLVNAWLYPSSLSGSFWSLFISKPVAMAAACLLVGTVGAYFLLWALRRLGRSKSISLVAASALGLVVLSASTSLAGGDARGAAVGRPPDVIVIGLDSMRPDHVAALGAPVSVTPHLDQWLPGSFVFRDTLTALPHTFPSTVAILTGQWPTHNGARTNLFPPHRIQREAAIAHEFRQRGYATVMAMDETRFANIDETFGFGRLVGPKMGAIDFLMTAMGDNVLVNLASGAPFTRRLFPYISGNRAIAHTYDPQIFPNDISSAVRDAGDRPLFLYTHFCAAHWPYLRLPIHMQSANAGQAKGTYADTSRAYLDSLTIADEQFGRLMATLEQQGRLENAIVVVLSDHGEDFDMVKDQNQVHGAGRLVDTFMNNGHGSSATRAPQVNVLLAFRGYGSQKLRPGNSSYPASLIDVSPTLAALTGMSAQKFDGISLAPALGHPGTLPPLDRARFVESTYRPVAMDKAEIVAEEVAAEAAHMYRVEPSGRLVLKDELVDFQVSFRQRAVFRGDWAIEFRKEMDAPPRILNRAERMYWPLESAPPQARSGQLVSDACLHWKGDERFQRAYCSKGPELASQATQ